MKQGPIGIFDSGVGGTSIWREVQKGLPNEDTIYLADGKNAPYGEKTKKSIRELSVKNTELLLQHGCKLIVVACNTATTNAISVLREKYPVPFVGIEPAIKPAALESELGIVGVLATRGTLASELFHKTSLDHANHIEILEQEGTGLVELIESGHIHSEKTKKLLGKYVEPMLAKGIDHLVLGCSHYPYLIPVLREMVPPHIKIIDSGEAVARQTRAMLEKYDLLNGQKNEGKHRFYSNTDVTVLTKLLGKVDVHMEVSGLDF
ncbi:MAG: glutamate racemase [Bacteroidota bacterium]